MEGRSATKNDMYEFVVLTTSNSEGCPMNFFVSLKSSPTMDETVEAVAKGAPRLTISPRPFESSSHAKLELTAPGPESAPKPRLGNHPSLAHSHDSDNGHTHSHEDSHDHAHDHSHYGDHRSHDPREQDSDPESLKIRQFYDIPPSMDIEEASYLLRTILSFKYYQRHTFATNHVRMKNFYSLPESQRNLLQPQFTQKLETIDHAIVKNGILAKSIAKLGEEMYLGGNEVRTGGPLTPRQKYVASNVLLIKGIWIRPGAP